MTKLNRKCNLVVAGSGVRAVKTQEQAGRERRMEQMRAEELKNGTLLLTERTIKSGTNSELLQKMVQREIATSAFKMTNPQPTCLLTINPPDNTEPEHMHIVII
ncbi:hypothetical protein T01_14490 [Trichinella spiralis]|uniref:Uncharacterized protein n=1 Tax=Trichinella spiralis TaxID=6334 RepID=A0A0V1BU24_TRISP|nr:hypothetical protein T01_14490 [Trichinella spiralis]